MAIERIRESDCTSEQRMSFFHTIINVFAYFTLLLLSTGVLISDEEGLTDWGLRLSCITISAFTMIYFKRSICFVANNKVMIAFVLCFLMCIISDVFNHSISFNVVAKWLLLCLMAILAFQTKSYIWSKSLSLFSFFTSIVVLLNYLRFTNIQLFDNPIGYASTIALCIPLVMHFEHNKLLRTTYCIMGIVAIICAKSRCCVLALIVFFFYYYAPNIKCYLKAKRHKIAYFMCIAIVLILCISGLYMAKVDSANGRLLIWQTLVKMCTQSLWWGLGSNAILAHYMPNQANILLSYNNMYQSWLADDVTHSFCEPLGIIVRYGIIGCASFLVFMYWTFRNTRPSNKKLFIGITIVWFVIALFSYPTYYATVSIIIVASCAVTQRIKSITLTHIQILPIHLICIVFFALSTHRMYYEHRWLMLYNKTDNDEKRMVETYNNLYPHLYHYPLFVYAYAVAYNLSGNASKSDSLYNILQSKINTYDTQLLHADNALTLHHYASAEDAFTEAHLMVPNRFMPLYGLMQTYMLKGDTIQARNIAKQIIVKDIKINSSEVDMIKHEAKKFIEQCKSDSINRNCQNTL